MPRVIRIACAAVLLLFAPAVGRAQSPEAVTLTVLHTNDLHGHILPFAYTEIGRSLKEQPSVGGAARRATLVREIRRTEKNPVVLVDSGDTFTRGPFTTTYLGIADVEAMNAVGYDLAAVGNNEFKAKDGADADDAPGAQAALLAVVKRARFPWLCANAIDAHGAMLEGVQPFVVRQFGPLRVGFLGLTAPRVATYPQAKGWTISDPIAAAKLYIPRARAQCDVLIAVTHIGVDLDKKLAAATTGIDAIVGGDSHTFLYKPLEVKNADGTATVPIVQDGEFGANLGRFDLTFTRAAPGWRLTAFHDALLPVGPTLAPATDVDAVIAPYAAPLLTVVGTLPSIVMGATAEERDQKTTRFVANVLRRRTRSDFAVSAAGGFFETFRTPQVTLYDIHAILPFNDHAVVATLTGAKLLALLTGDKTAEIAGDPKLIEPAKTYSVAFIDFVASSTYHLDPQTIRDTGRNVTDLMIDDIRSLHMADSGRPRIPVMDRATRTNVTAHR
jgi:5'-nucleotidase/UDP-sugar diphosphatase